MKRQTQKTGVRTYFGDDLVDLQTQPLNAIDAMLAAAGRCVISGCQITAAGDKYDVAPGYVALEAADQVSGVVRIMAMPFGGVSGVTLPVYLVASVDVVERAYGDGAVKPIAYLYSATAVAVRPLQNTSIEIAKDYTRRLADALAESLAKYITVTAAEKAAWSAKETPTGAQAKANAALVAAKDYTDSAVAGKANTNHGHGNATAAADGFMTKGDKAKLDSVEASANNYTHPVDANTRHVTDAEKAAWSGKASAAVATTTANGLMSSADKTKLNGVATGANNYTHPVAHAISEVSGLQTALDGKVAAEAYNGMQSRRQNSSSSYDAIRISPEGVVIIRGRNNVSQQVCRITGDGMEVPQDALFSMPGFLCRMRYLAGGSLVDRYGPKSVSKDAVKVGVGRYKVYHSISNQLYTPTPIPVVPLNGRNVYISCLIEKGYDAALNLYYTVIGFSDSTHGGWIDVDFEVTFNGRN